MLTVSSLADPTAPVNVVSVPVKTRTFSPWAVNDPVRVDRTVREPPAAS
jgi:hypothetical protein